MSSIEQYRGAGASFGLSRQVDRGLARIQGGTSLAVAKIEAQAEVNATKVDAMAAVTQRGLQGVAFMTQVEQQLAQAVPLAASRLQGLADIGALGMSQIIMDTATDLRRL
ncbi:hypothetical protein SAMN05444157_0715 [Frankineae bacterium MT45]|nr:hypothetical protein SAMN05444157_0715 [Frankineae bacterium MT45]